MSVSNHHVADARLVVADAAFEVSVSHMVAALLRREQRRMEANVSVGERRLGTSTLGALYTVPSARRARQGIAGGTSSRSCPEASAVSRSRSGRGCAMFGRAIRSARFQHLILRHMLDCRPRSSQVQDQLSSAHVHLAISYRRITETHVGVNRSSAKPQAYRRRIIRLAKHRG
jgi:hypothetical protein